MTDVPVIGLAKEHEDIYLPGRQIRSSWHAARRGYSCCNASAMRHIASRYPITGTCGKAATRSVLEDVPGIGPKRRRALLKHFGSLDAVRQASVDELAAARG